ncbi:MAG: hypothetical protein M3Q42_03090 [Pseudomonadota bacterium]|nr:hypothetical protein [Pseudomonadota bacterium]
MARDRKFNIRDGVLLNRKRGDHGWVHNRVLQARTTVEAAAETLIAETLQQIEQGYVAGQLFPVYNAWCVVDVLTLGTTDMIGGVNLSDVRLPANFFVRLGRSPALSG